MDHKRVVYYKDFNNDDFARAGDVIDRKPLPEDFKWVKKSRIYQSIASLLYWISLPVVWLIMKIVYNVKVVGKKKLNRGQLKGAFVYGNHTQEADGVLPQVFVTNPYRSLAVCSQDVVNITGIRWLVMLLGALPIPHNVDQSGKFLDAMKYHHSKGHPIIIFPEAHIWPYTTLIRDFPDSSFTYPAQLNAPVCAICVTYEERKILRSMPPRIVIHVSDVFYPDASLPLGERAHTLREQCYNFMVDTSSSLDNYEYIHYVHVSEDNNEFDTADDMPVVKEDENDITFEVSDCK